MDHYTRGGEPAALTPTAAGEGCLNQLGCWKRVGWLCPSGYQTDATTGPQTQSHGQCRRHNCQKQRRGETEQSGSGALQAKTTVTAWRQRVRGEGGASRRKRSGIDTPLSKAAVGGSAAGSSSRAPDEIDTTSVKKKKHLRSL
eukprot:CAMPEP_0174835062 /NCGR_PEP_ID=MMETSP1114-20130205/5216_1 /TAXON_ID=312471 /ORGANISM="Neobodo designis, Strain CCAP 1951/1" /LENGTH=142 /DNA_ID=CAMNT_0016069005 /DNA_START=115 /DNA_END=541 /DNA_ORIENTATION=+